MNEWLDIKSAPKDGTQVLLWCENGIELGSFRRDENDRKGEKMWLDNSYDDFSCGYASCPLNPTRWMPLPPTP